ncbi:unnamed protein product [Caenorhabditis sp. 36 PRJEB53466]|nr:unnamed protein product [Caenorhabditis sp. 36 PRJEB53466]
MQTSALIPSANGTGTIVAGINCDTIEYVQRYSPIVLTQIAQFLFAYTSASLIIGARAIQQQAYFHPNVKVLLKTYHAAVLMYGFALGTAQIYHILTALSYENCELLISCRLCFGFRLIITTCVIMFSLLLFAITVERTVATRNLGRGYENQRGSLGRLLSFLVVTFSVFYSMWYHWIDIYDRTCTHCVYDKHIMVPTELMNVLTVLSMLSLLYTILILLFNKCKLRKKSYSLAIEFQINQNLRVLHLILPLSFLTFLAFCWYTASPYYIDLSLDSEVEIRQFHEMVQNVFPVYTLLVSSLWLAMMYMEKKKKRIGSMLPELRKDEKDLYFQTLNDQWSRVPSQKPGRLQILSVFSVPSSSLTS